MVPKADSRAFLLLFLLVLTVTEPLRPGARREGRGAGGGAGGARGWGRLGPPSSLRVASWEVTGGGLPAGRCVLHLDPWPSGSVP